MSTTGSGTKADPYVITTYQDFYTLTYNIGTERWIKLANNIDLNFATWNALWSGSNSSQIPKCHVDLNGYGFLNVVVPSADIIRNGSIIDTYLFCGYEWYNGTIDIHSDPDDSTPPLNYEYLAWHGSVTCSTTTFTKVKFTGYLNVSATYIYPNYYNRTVIFRGMFNYCEWDMDINFNTYNSNKVPQGDLMCVFCPTYNSKISDYVKTVPYEYQMLNCDVNVRIYDWCYPYNATNHYCYLFRDTGSKFAIYNNRFRGTLGSRLTLNLSGWFMTSRANVQASDRVHNNVVNIDFHRVKMPAQITVDGQIVTSVDVIYATNTVLYQSNVFNTDYLRYVNLRRAVTANGFIGCTIGEITDAVQLQGKGFPTFPY